MTIAPRDIRTVFMGTPEFALPTLDGLMESGVDLCAVFTQPDRPKGRGKKLSPPPVKALAAERGIPVLQPIKLRDAGGREQAFGSWLPTSSSWWPTARFCRKSVLEIPRFGCINVHASLLPRYRGAAPINKAVIDGETETGVTTMLMDVGLDTGDMLVKRATAIGPEETAGELHNRLARLGREAMEETLRRLCAGTLSAEPQDERLSSYAPMLKKEDGRIDWTQSARRFTTRCGASIPGREPTPGWRGRFSRSPTPSPSSTMAERLGPC